jgi:hypothetical protein
MGVSVDRNKGRQSIIVVVLLLDANLSCAGLYYQFVT